MTVTRKHLLNKSKVEYMSGEGIYTMNHVQGCAHGCLYCYAQKMAQRFGQVISYDGWRRVQIVANALDILEADLKMKRKEPVRRVHLCFTTDPFPFIYDHASDASAILEQIRQISTNAIKLINSYGIPVTVLSKGMIPLSLRDLHPDNEFGVTFTTWDTYQSMYWEPYAALPSTRFSFLNALSSYGEKTWISIEPFGLIHPDFSRESKKHAGLEDILESFAFVDRIVFGKANYMPSAYKNPAWYRECAGIVQDFCKRHAIECIIKKGTADE